MGMAKAEGARATYVEAANWSLSVWLFWALMNLAISFALWAAYDGQVAWGAAIICALATVAISRTSRLKISINGELLKVGVAQLALSEIEQVRICDSALMASLRTRQADRRAYLALRFWVKSGVQIFLADPKDPTPYWLVSSKKPTLLASALQKQN
jgi:hypothetical protein